MFLVCAATLFGGGIIIFFGLVTHPQHVGESFPFYLHFKILIIVALVMVSSSCKDNKVFYLLTNVTNEALLPAATKLGQGNIFTSVCLSTVGEGCLPQCMLGYPYPPPTPRPGTPWEADPHPPRPWADTPPTRTPRSRHPPGPGTPREADPPPGKQTAAYG